MTAEKKKFQLVAIFISVFACALAILVLRRPDHLFYPELWDEDGAFILPQEAQHGWITIFWPVQGYLVVPWRALSFVAMHLSFTNYPIVALTLALIVQAGSVATIAISPTRLPLAPICALLTVLVPTDPEVLLTPLYTFWWTGLLIFPALLWRNDAPQTPRLAMIVIAGLSSPIVVPVSSLFVLLALYRRRPQDFAAAAVTLVVAALQTLVFLNNRVASAGDLSISSFVQAAIRFAGLSSYAIGTDYVLVWAVVVLSVLLTGMIFLPRADRATAVLLFAAFAMSAMAAAARVPVEALHPVLAGPRYFFLPAILISWILVTIAARTRLPFRVAPAVVLLATLPLLSTSLVRHHKPLSPDWRRSLNSCVGGDGIFKYAIQFNGNPTEAWGAEMPQWVCAMRKAKALF